MSKDDWPSIFIGFDPREERAYDLCAWSLLRHASTPLNIQPISRIGLELEGLYQRQTEKRNGQLWDVISEAPMSTEFSIARFFIPFLATTESALYLDCDMLLQRDVCELFGLFDPSKAVQVVKHAQRVTPNVRKMDNQVQTTYARKNWSSLVLWNVGHPSHQALDLRALNAWPGRDLHAFLWLADDQIGSLPMAWNYLVGCSDSIGSPSNLHFTLGTPDMEGYGNSPYADRWEREAEFLAAWQRRK